MNVMRRRRGFEACAGTAPGPRTCIRYRDAGLPHRALLVNCSQRSVDRIAELRRRMGGRDLAPQTSSLGDTLPGVGEDDGGVVKRVLLTGLSGTGKSTLIRELAGRGYKAVDLDADEWSEWVDVAFGGDPTSPESPVEAGRDWVWREDRLHDLLSTEDADVLFVGGCAENMGKFRAWFDQIVLLSVPVSVLVERLATRTTNPYGKRPEEAARVLGQVRTIEPLLRRVAGHDVDTSAPLDQVVAQVLQLVGVRA